MPDLSASDLAKIRLAQTMAQSTRDRAETKQGFEDSLKPAWIDSNGKIRQLGQNPVAGKNLSNLGWGVGESMVPLGVDVVYVGNKSARSATPLPAASPSPAPTPVETTCGVALFSNTAKYATLGSGGGSSGGTFASLGETIQLVFTRTGTDVGEFLFDLGGTATVTTDYVCGVNSPASASVAGNILTVTFGDDSLTANGSIAQVTGFSTTSTQNLTITVTSQSDDTSVLGWMPVIVPWCNIVFTATNLDPIYGTPFDDPFLDLDAWSQTQYTDFTTTPTGDVIQDALNDVNAEPPAFPASSPPPYSFAMTATADMSIFEAVAGMRALDLFYYLYPVNGDAEASFEFRFWLPNALSPDSLYSNIQIQYLKVIESWDGSASSTAYSDVLGSLLSPIFDSGSGWYYVSEAFTHTYAAQESVVYYRIAGILINE